MSDIILTDYEKNYRNKTAGSNGMTTQLSTKETTLKSNSHLKADQFKYISTYIASKE